MRLGELLVKVAKPLDLMGSDKSISEKKVDRAFTPLANIKSAMLDELVALERLSPELAEKVAKHDEDHSAQGAALSAGGVATGLGSAKLVDHLGLRQPSERDLELGSSLAASSPVSVVRSSGGSKGGFVPAHGKNLAQVRLRDDVNAPEILAHELGHADIHQHPLGRAAQSPLARDVFEHATHPLVGLGVGALSAHSDNERVRQLGRWAPALAGLPTLASEVGASALGLAKMRQHGASGPELARAAGTLLPAFGTYAGRAAMGAGMAHAGQTLETERIKHKKKTGAVTDDQARSSLNRLESLERNRPTMRQVARYGTIGAIAAPLASMATNAVRGKPILDPGTTVQKLREVAGRGLGGAVTGGALPLLRSHLDRKAELGTLRTYMDQQGA